MEGKRLVILVEGDCEIILMKKLIIPYLYKEVEKSKGWAITTQKITTNRQLNKKGGIIGFTYFVNEVKRVSSQGCTIITTFFDFFGLPADFPEYTTDSNKIGEIEIGTGLKLQEEIPDLPEFLPYIQLHEFEALLFSDIKGFELLTDKQEMERLKSIIDSYDNPELIDGGRETAPSKRLKHIYNYEKVKDSEIILELTGFETIYNKCPRFRAWIDCLKKLIIKLS